MAKPIKCVILGKSRQPHIVFVKGDQEAFSDGNDRYSIDPSRYVVTRHYRFNVWPGDYMTLYYRQGYPKPIPPYLPPPENLSEAAQYEITEALEAQETLMTSREWESVRDPELFEVLKGGVKNKFEDAMRWVHLATLTGVGYIAFFLER